MVALFFFLLVSSSTRRHFGVAITGLGAADLTTAINPRTRADMKLQCSAGEKAVA